MLNWSPDQVIGRWKISVDLFSRLFLADGPGAERDSFLAARAGVAGRLARYVFRSACRSENVVLKLHEILTYYLVTPGKFSQSPDFRKNFCFPPKKRVDTPRFLLGRQIIK